MSEFFDICAENERMQDTPEPTEEMTDVTAEISGLTEGADISGAEAADLRTEAQKAADYARARSFDKAGDYIERHFDADVFVEGEPIPIKTRNMALKGSAADNGVGFNRRVVELTDGLSVSGVFPDFDSKHHTELGSRANDMSIYEQFAACRDDFQDHMYDSSEKIEGITIGDMEKMAKPNGFAPEGYTWNHGPATGSFDLVSKDDHAVGHTGGNALWGSSGKKTDI